MEKKKNQETSAARKVLILHNIRSIYNVGAIFRTADAIGVDTIYLTGYTPSPIDRFGRKRDDLAKCALGAEDSVAWVEKGDVHEAIAELHAEGFEIVALEQDKQSVNYTKYTPRARTALLLGNEPKGIDREILDHCDAIIEIPMRGAKESLNVSVAAGVALFRLFDT